MIIFKVMRKFSFYIILFCFIFSSGCAHVISKDFRAKTDPSLTFGEVFKNPNTYKGKMVIWGGEIVQTHPQKDETILIEALEWPLGRRGEPRRTVFFQGKFLVFVKEPLDLSLYKRGTKITVAGEIQGAIQGEKIESLGEISYRYPIISSRQIYLWKDFFQYSAPYDQQRYDPSYDPHRGAGILRY